MLYTIGYKPTYDPLFETENNPKKIGKRPEEDYSGGAVYHSEEEARQNAPEDFDVYGLDATKEDIEENPNEKHDNLINDSKLIKLS